MRDFVLNIQIVSFYINDSALLMTDMGPIDLESKRRFINWVAWLSIPVVNVWLRPGFPVPNNFLGMFTVKDATFESKEGYVSIGVVPQFF
jgi:hypothetical protein